MRASAIYFAQQINEKLRSGQLDSKNIDLIFTSDMIALCDLRALLPRELRPKPIVCYFHENQLTYPLQDESERDYQYGFTNITTCLAADAVWFNSRYHYESFLVGVTALLKKMPDFVPAHLEKTIAESSAIMPLGLAPELFTLKSLDRTDNPPTILWNHRWEYDKNPDEFFEVLFDLDRSGVDFRLIVAGENFRTAPPIFAAVEKLLAYRIDHFGYAPDRKQYLELLQRSDIVISTAHHEFFGLSILEAIAANCYPLLPGRLSYPELIPQTCHANHFYDSADELRQKLHQICTAPVRPLSTALLDHVAGLSWDKLAHQYDTLFEQILK